MRRREFTTLLAGTAMTWSLPAHGQQQSGKRPRIGSIESAPAENTEALIEGLRDVGYVDGQNVILEPRYHHGSLDRIDELARELVSLKCNVIVAAAPYAIRAVLKETNTIPTVGLDLESDPVAAGWAKSLARPGGNVTGLFLDVPELGGKQIELLRRVVPTITDLAVLWDATIATLQFRATEAAAQSLGINLRSFPIRNADEIKDAVDRAAHDRVHGMIVLTSPLIFNQRSQIADLALKERLPTISIFNSYPKVGGLMAYGPNLPSMFKRAATYVDRILSGAKPSDLPIERPTKFELVINLRTGEGARSRSARAAPAARR